VALPALFSAFRSGPKKAFPDSSVDAKAAALSEDILKNLQGKLQE